MDRSRRRKLVVLVSSVVAIVAIVLLSAGLPQLELLPGRPFRLGGGGQTGTVDLGALPGGDALMILLRVSFVLAWVLLPVAIIYFVISPVFRKQVLRGFASLLSAFLMAYALMRVLPGLLTNEDGPGGPGTMPSLEVFSPQSFAEFVAEPSMWLVLATSVGLAVLVAGLLVGGTWFVWRRFHPPASPLKQLAQEAQGALESLQAGVDLKNVVKRCYVQMARVLDAQRGIRRQRQVTPREFERRLEDAGLPGEPVRQLTRLFEDVRYGTRVTGEQEERRAMACLKVIVDACSDSS